MVKNVSLLPRCLLPLGRRRARMTLSGMRLCSSNFLSESSMKRMFWHMLPGPVIGGQGYRVPPLSKGEEKKAPFHEKT